MRAASWVVTAVLSMAFSACNCGPVTGPDGGTGGGNTGGGTTGGGGGSGGGSGGGGGAAAQFTLTLNPGALSLAPGGTGSVSVEVVRVGSFAGDVQLSLENAPAGVTAVFTPNPVNSSTTLSVMGLTIPMPLDAGISIASVKGTSGTDIARATLALTITPPADVLLVDDDGSENNYNTVPATPSASDVLFTQLLTAAAVPYVQYVVPASTNGPTFEQVKNFKTVIWYTGARYGGGGGNVETISSTDELVLKAFLDQGNRKVLIFANSYLYGLPAIDWTSNHGNGFVGDYLGLEGGAVDKLNDATFTATGGAATTMAGLIVSVGYNNPISTFTDPVNPKVGTDSLFTAMLDPDGNGVAQTCIASGRKNIGTAGNSKAVYFGFSFENIVDVGSNSKPAVFNRLLAY